MKDEKLQNSFVKRLIPEASALLVAEISANHDKDLDQALSLLEVAADAGWHCVKLQTYSADSLTMRSEHPSMKIDPVWGYSNLHELYSAASMPMEFHEPLFARARELGLLPFTSVYDPMDLPFLEDLGCQIYKIASFELTFDDLLIEVASTGKPIILSTGMSEMSEVDHAVDLIRRSGNTELAVLHCCSAYPAPYDSINLNSMLTMQERFDLPVGFSDHTVDAVASLTAISMGACLIEKHFTNDPNRSGPDHRFSATPQILKEISHGLRIIDQLRGKHVKKSASEEAENKIRGRRSAFAVRNLCQGDIIQNDDFRFVRPGVGVPANQKHLLIGKVLLTEIPAGYPITLDDLGQ